MLQTIGACFLSAPFIRACKIFLAGGIAFLAFALVFPRFFSDTPHVMAMLGMNALFIGIALHDLQTRRVPNLVTYPLMAGGILRAILLRDPGFLAYWGVLWLLWTARFMGGGDAKLLMGLFGLFPDIRMTWLVSASVLVTGIPFLTYKHRRALISVRGWRSALRDLGLRLVTLQLLPSQIEFEKEAVPFAFSFCLAGAAYLSFYAG